MCLPILYNGFIFEHHINTPCRSTNTRQDRVEYVRLALLFASVDLTSHSLNHHLLSILQHHLRDTPMSLQRLCYEIDLLINHTRLLELLFGFFCEEVDDVETDDSFEESEDEETEETEEDEEKEEPVDESVIREYVDKVTKGLANSTEDSFVQKKSPVSAKPSMVPGISAKNLNQGGVSQGRPNPKSGEFTSEKIANRPGANSGVKSLKPAPKPVTTKEEPGVNKKSVEA